MNCRFAFTLLGLAALMSASMAIAGDKEIAQPAPAQNPSLFGPGEVIGAVFGESANGTVDLDTHTTVVHHTTTTITHTVVPVPPVPVATPSPPPTEFRPAARGAATLRLVDPTVKVTHKTRRLISRPHEIHNAGGGGFELGYFFTRFFGVAVETSFLGGEQFETVVTGNLIFRYPFEFGQRTMTAPDGKTTVSGPVWGLAPYVLAGGGGQWGARSVGLADVGGGIEFRFSRHYGIFLEDRWVVHDERQNYNAVTAGFVANY